MILTERHFESQESKTGNIERYGACMCIYIYIYMYIYVCIYIYIYVISDVQV
jgi:hypothetical protein